MNENLPDLSKIVERLMRPYLNVTLAPMELVDNGSTMRLCPQRNGCSIADINLVRRDTFPTLDLSQAGIEIDRRPDSIHRAVESLLRNVAVLLKPEFDVLWEYVDASVNDVTVVHEAAAQAERNLERSATDAEISRYVSNLVINAREVGIRLETTKGPIAGLDLSHPIRGWRGAVVSCLIPLACPEHDVLNAAGRFVVAERQLANAQKARKKHLSNGGGQWIRHPVASLRLWAVDKVQPTFRSARLTALNDLNESITSLA